MATKRKTEIDSEGKREETLFLSAKAHTNPEEEACRRPAMETYRKQAGKDRKSPAIQQVGSHSPAIISA